MGDLTEYIALTGASRTSYSLRAYTLDTTFKPVGAVYAIARRFTDDDGRTLYAIVYVGQTEDLSGRFEYHHKTACFRGQQANCIGLLVEGDERTRLRVEADLIAQYRPPCNG
jgi:hypothetical protein